MTNPLNPLTPPDAPLGAHPLVLDRLGVAREVQRYFGQSLDVLKELIDYATNLEVRIHGMGVGETDRVVAVGVLFHRIIALLDATELLLRAGQVYSARIQTRALIEASWNLEWMLKADVSRRACQYYVLDLRNRVAELERFIPGTASNKEFEKVIESAKYLDAKNIFSMTPEDLAAIRKSRDDILQRIEEVSEFKAISIEIDKRKKLVGLKWFQLFGGPNETRDLAIKLSHLHEYEVFFRLDSNAVHGTWVQDHISIKNEIARAVPIRSLREFVRVGDVAWDVGFRTTEQVIRHFREGEMLAFVRQFVPNGKLRWNPPEVEVDIEAVVPYRNG
ncbi:MAG TPA: DUF5677 domain-containing protein [Longimicrobium sp.]|jgi:hypothetical protein